VPAYINNDDLLSTEKQYQSRSPLLFQKLDFTLKPTRVIIILCLFLVIIYLSFDDCIWVWIVSRFYSEVIINRYHGHRVSPGDLVERRALPLSSEEFYHQYQDRCKPVILTVPGGFKAMGWNTDLWTEGYLLQRAGDVVVDVEKKTTQFTLWETI